MVTAHRTTLDEFLGLPDDGLRHELVRGEIISMPPPKVGHGLMEHDLAAAIDRYLYRRALALGWPEDGGNEAFGRLVGRIAQGDAGVRLHLPDDHVQIRGLDLGYFSPEQVARLSETFVDNYAPEMPVLVAEIISPSESAAYIEEKVQDCITGGAQLVWLVFPRTRTVRVVTPDGIARTLTHDDRLDGGEILPGFSLKLSTLFS
jgi:Uma2 family endonuclease